MVMVGAILENSNDGKILLVKRSRSNQVDPEVWEDLGGRLKQFENFETGLRREIFEEVGISEIEIVKPIRIGQTFLGEKKAENETLLVVFWCKTGTDAVSLSDEHTEYKWLTPEEGLRLVTHPGIRTEISAFINERASTKGI